MCGRFTLRQPMNKVLEQFDCPEPQWQLALRYNIAPTQEIPVVRQNNGGRELTLMRWGLVPSWSKDPKSGFKTINARSETVATSKMFGPAFKKRRCLIPADGFYEWQTDGKKKLPIHFHRPDNGLFAFAGLWEKSQFFESCTILTTAAAEWFKPYHDRMPVILAPNDYRPWLDTTNTDLGYLFEPASEDELTATPVNPVVNNARHEGADCLEPMA